MAFAGRIQKFLSIHTFFQYLRLKLATLIICDLIKTKETMPLDGRRIKAVPLTRKDEDMEGMYCKVGICL